MSTIQAYRYSLLHEDVWGEGGDQVMQEVRLILKQLRCLVLHSSLQRLGIGTGDTVPCLGLTPIVYSMRKPFKNTQIAVSESLINWRTTTDTSCNDWKALHLL